MTSSARIGWVKYFDAKGGFGFLTDVGSGADVFVHFSALQRRDRGWRGLMRGEYVQYRLTVGRDGRSAASEVTGVAGGPLLCEASSIEQPEFS